MDKLHDHERKAKAAGLAYVGAYTMESNQKYKGKRLRVKRDGLRVGYLTPEGKRHGPGILTDIASGDQYSGLWSNNVREGFGIHTDKTGFKYEGDWS